MKQADIYILYIKVIQISFYLFINQLSIQLCINLLNLSKLLYNYRGIREKGSGDVVSAVCYTIYTINLSLCTQTAETTSIFRTLFVNSPVYQSFWLYFYISTLCYVLTICQKYAFCIIYLSIILSFPSQKSYSYLKYGGSGNA